MKVIRHAHRNGLTSTAFGVMALGLGYSWLSRNHHAWYGWFELGLGVTLLVLASFQLLTYRALNRARQRDNEIQEKARASEIRARAHALDWRVTIENQDHHSDIF